jgi:hypothetical protein
MPKAATTPAPHLRQDVPANTTATAPAPATAPAKETAAHDNGHRLTREAEPRLRSPQQFYAELTKRLDVQAFLKRLADR